MADNEIDKANIDTWEDQNPEVIIGLMIHDVNNLIHHLQNWATLIQEDIEADNLDPELVSEAMDQLMRKSETVAELMKNARRHADKLAQQR